jgi:hypothetical protein
LGPIPNPQSPNISLNDAKCKYKYYLCKIQNLIN